MKPRPFTLMFACFLLSAAFPVFAQTRQPDNRPRNSTIAGQVTVGKIPVANQIVIATARPEPGGATDLHMPGAASNPSYSARTDADGRYRIAGLRAGEYEVRPLSKAYALEKKADKEHRTVTLEDNETEENVNFALVRGGVITGRVTDDEGHPLIEQHILVKSVAEDSKLREQGVSFERETAGTDDRGVYRVYGLEAGRYIVSAGGSANGMFGQSASKYPQTYYPGVLNEAQARIIEVTAGGEATEIDIRLGSAKKTYEVVGKIKDAETGQPVVRASLLCMGASKKDDVVPNFTGMAASDAQGNFRFNGLPSGGYLIQLSPDVAVFSGNQSDYYVDKIEFEVTDSDVSGLEISAKRGASISGAAIIEGTPEQKKKTNLAQLMLSSMVARRGSENAGEADFSMSGLNATKLGNDGSFRLTGLKPGTVTFHVFSFGGAFPRVMRIERDGVEMREGIEIKGNETVTGVRIVLAQANGVIRGQVNFVGNTSPDGWRIIATVTRKVSGPEPDTRSTDVDAKGRFTIDELLDGEYAVTVTATPPGAPEKTSLPSDSQTVQLTGGAEAQVTLTLNLNKKGQ